MHHPSKLFPTTVLLAVLTVAPAVHSARAQSCVTFQALPERASLVIRGPRNFASGAPGSFCALTRETNYRVTIAHPGYETRNVNFKLHADGDIDLSGVWYGPFARSMLVPGWGQMSMGNKARGTWAFAIGTSAGGYLLASYLAYDEARKAYDSTSSLAESATTQQQLDALQAKAVEQAVDANVKKGRFDDILIFTAYVHASNIAESFLLSRPPDASVDGSTIRLKTSALTRTRATMRSVLFPGLGQKYMGSQFKGWFMQSLFIGAAVWTIEERADYARAKKMYELDQRRLDGATAIDEIEAARVQVEQSWDNARKRERRTNLSYIVLGSAWLWNVLDAALITDPQTRGGRIGFETSFRSSSGETGSFGTTMTWRF